jgi:hypothetical protein
VPVTLDCPSLGVSWLQIQTSDVPTDSRCGSFTRNGIR